MKKILLAFALIGCVVAVNAQGTTPHGKTKSSATIKEVDKVQVKTVTGVPTNKATSATATDKAAPKATSTTTAPASTTKSATQKNVAVKKSAQTEVRSIDLKGREVKKTQTVEKVAPKATEADPKK